MNKKIFTIFALILLVASISAVSAFDLGDLFGSGKNETITIDGVKFNIPAGYKENQSNTTNNRLNEIKKKIELMLLEQLMLKIQTLLE